MTTNPTEDTKSLLNGHVVAMRVIPANFELHRLFRYPGGDFKPAPPDRRKGRLDPPWGRRQDYGVLYTSDCLMTAAIECRAVLLEATDPPTYKVSGFADIGQPSLQWATLSAGTATRFVDLTDSFTARVFGLDPLSILDFLDPWRAASACIFDALNVDHTKDDVMGICYRSQRDAQTLNYAMFQGRYESAFESLVKSPFDPGALTLTLN